MHTCTHAAPDGTPYNLTVVEVTSEQAMLSWDPPHSHLHNGIIREYLVQVVATVEELGGSSSEEGVIHRTSTTSALLAGLHPDYSYSVRVAARTVQVGPYTDPVHFHTLEDGMFVKCTASTYLT